MPLFPNLAHVIFIFTIWAQHQALSWHLCPNCHPATVALSPLGQGAGLLNRMDLPEGSRKWTLLLLPTVSKCQELTLPIGFALGYGDFDFVGEARGLQTCRELPWGLPAALGLCLPSAFLSHDFFIH